MKLRVDFSDLWRNVENMGAAVGVFVPKDGRQKSPFDLKEVLQTTGVEIRLAEIEVRENLLSFNDQQIVWYIPKQHGDVAKVIKSGIWGTKIHIARCKTLIEMEQKNSLHKYFGSTNMTGELPVHGKSKGGYEEEGVARLSVCQHCVTKLNYQGADVSKERTYQVVKNFNLLEFFATYTAVFERLPNQLIYREDKGYAADWPAISRELRRQANYVCQSCHVDLSAHQQLLHSHHINRKKSDNRPDNLKVLCADCHRKAPFHEHLGLLLSDRRLIGKLRKQQASKPVANLTWEDIVAETDPAIAGVIAFCRDQDVDIPEPNYELEGAMGEVKAQFELAWPDIKLGVYLGNRPKDTDWKVLSLAEAIEHFRAMGEKS